MKVIHASTDKVAFEKQVQIRDFYDKGWTHILRCSSGKKLAEFALKVCSCNMVGYSQALRRTFYDFMKSHSLSDLNKRVYVDCSSFVESCLMLIGAIPVFKGINTRNMVDTLGNYGFKILKYDKAQLINGDIILKEGSHCGIISDSTNIAAEIPVNVPIQQAANHTYNWTGIVTAASLRVRSYPNGPQIKSLFRNDEILVIESNGSWLHIRYRDIDGWVSKDYVRKV